MKFVNGRVVYSLVFYTMAVMLIYLAKPDMMFANDGELKTFGVGNDRSGSPKTVFSFGVFAIVLAITSFYLFSVIDLVFSQ